MRRLLHQEARELGRAIVAEQSRIGWNDDADPLVQPAMQEAAAIWLEKWAGLLRDDPASAVGPLASLMAEVFEVTNRHLTGGETAAELAERLGFKPHGRPPG